MKIRIATEQDVGQIKMLLDRNFDEIMIKHHSKAVRGKFKSHNTYEHLLGQLKWKRIYVVEDDGGEVIATGAFVNFGSAEKPKYSVSNLYVIPEKHSKGIGRMLFQKLYEDAKANRAASFHVPASRNAIGFYEKMGFTVDAEQSEVEDEITWMAVVIN